MTAKPAKKKKASAPKPMDMRPYEAFLAFIEEQNRVLHLCMSGLLVVEKRPKAAEALYKVRALLKTPAPLKRDIAKLRKEARFAKREIAMDFPTLHAHFAVGLWSALEVLVEDICVMHLKESPQLLASERVSSLKISVGRFMTMDDDERRRTIVDQFSLKSRTEFSAGPGVLEGLLELVDLGGSIGDRTRRQLCELRAARNIIVHRGGIADRRMAEACPWLRIRPGQPFLIVHKRYSGYWAAAYDYFLELMLRRGEKGGHVRNELDVLAMRPEVPDVERYTRPRVRRRKRVAESGSDVVS